MDLKICSLEFVCFPAIYNPQMNLKKSRKIVKIGEFHQNGGFHPKLWISPKFSDFR